MHPQMTTLLPSSQVIEVLPSLEGGKGKLLGAVDFGQNARNITSLVFGGEQLTDLYVTSARVGDPEKIRKYAGSLFRVRGLKSYLDGEPVSGFEGFEAKI